MTQKNGSLQFSLRDLALAVYMLAAFLAIGRAAQEDGAGPGQKTLLAWLAVYLGGFLALWANRRPTSIALMLAGLAIVLVGAVLCGGFY